MAQILNISVRSQERLSYIAKLGLLACVALSCSIVEHPLLSVSVFLSYVPVCS